LKITTAANQSIDETCPVSVALGSLQGSKTSGLCFFGFGTETCTYAIVGSNPVFTVHVT
jgi:hypothetical protein